MTEVLSGVKGNKPDMFVRCPGCPALHARAERQVDAAAHTRTLGERVRVRLLERCYGPHRALSNE